MHWIIVSFPTPERIWRTWGSWTWLICHWFLRFQRGRINPPSVQKGCFCNWLLVSGFLQMAYWELPHQKFRIYPDLLSAWKDSEVFYELNLDTHDLEAKILYVYNHLEEFHTTEELCGWLNELCRLLCRKLDSSLNDYHQKLCESVTSYIDENYASNTLCLNDIASEANVSPAYLSALFKRNRAWVSVTISLLSESTPPAVILQPQTWLWRKSVWNAVTPINIISAQASRKNECHSICIQRYSDVKILAFTCVSYDSLYNKEQCLLSWHLFYMSAQSITFTATTSVLRKNCQWQLW